MPFKTPLRPHSLAATPHKLLAVVAGNADQQNTDFQSHSDTMQAHSGHSRNTVLNQTILSIQGKS